MGKIIIKLITETIEVTEATRKQFEDIMVQINEKENPNNCVAIGDVSINKKLIQYIQFIPGEEENGK